MMRSAQTHSTEEAFQFWLDRVRRYPQLPEITGRLFSKYHRDFGRDLPWRKRRDPYEILIAEIMLQKTHNRVVPVVWDEFVNRWPAPAGLARARLRSLEKVLHPLGLRKRAAWLREIGKIIAGDQGILKTYEGLRSLPGVGNYTSSAVLCQAFDKQLAMVDVNAARVYCRIYGVRMNTQRQALAFAELAAAAAIRFAPAREVNLGVVDFAQAICRVDPAYSNCPLFEVCAYGRLVSDAESSSSTRRIPIRGDLGG